jgi:hypothetical protein
MNLSECKVSFIRFKCISLSPAVEFTKISIVIGSGTNAKRISRLRSAINRNLEFDDSANISRNVTFETDLGI